MLDGNMNINSNGKVNLLGINMGGLGTILSENDEYIAIKWPAHTYWAGILTDRVYASPRIIIYRKDKKTTKASHANKARIWLTALIEWDVTRKKKEER